MLPGGISSHWWTVYSVIIALYLSRSNAEDYHSFGGFILSPALDLDRRAFYPKCIYDTKIKWEMKAKVRGPFFFRDCFIACPKEIKYVCGNDGETYPNLCTLCYMGCLKNRHPDRPVIIYKACDGQCPCNKDLNVQKKINEIEAHVKRLQNRKTFARKINIEHDNYEHKTEVVFDDDFRKDIEERLEADFKRYKDRETNESRNKGDRYEHKEENQVPGKPLKYIRFKDPENIIRICT